ncbi:DUF7119 family protein [Halovivax limisalsi]|uniref:DUF7119 family protein n=1 Tax=Halovivax limisalsi TaxID=1453760 RepID=UPI001FFDA2F0|nr:hypothetical protein [Halovivax limisalsi]
MDESGEDIDGDGTELNRGEAATPDPESIPTGRESPVGAPVIRGDETITGDHADEAVGFDPDDPASVAEAAETVRAFATGGLDANQIEMLRGAAACAALVRGVGSYTDAVERAGGEVTVSFVRKWGRVHDLPRSVRLAVARGELVPSAAKHIARLGGRDRHVLAWAAIDADLSVREIRSVASRVLDGDSLDAALADVGATVGRFEVNLPPDAYIDLRRRASLAGVDPGAVVAEALTDAETETFNRNSPELSRKGR